MDAGKRFRAEAMNTCAMKSTLMAAFCVVGLLRLTTAPSLGGDFRFQHHYIDRDLPGDSYGQTCLVDLDKDGDLDFITGGKDQQKTVYWFEFQSADKWVRHALGTNH